MQLDKQSTEASMALSVVHALLAKGELGRLLRTVGLGVAISDEGKDKFFIRLEGYPLPITFAIKQEGVNDQLGALLIGITPSNIPRGLVRRGSGVWLLFEPISDGVWGTNMLAIDPKFPTEKDMEKRDWAFYSQLALNLREK